MRRHYHADARPALTEASRSAPSAVAYSSGKGWYVYNPANGCGESEPEFFVPGRGRYFPLSATAKDVLASAIRSSVIQIV
jgi:hypothetical protein